MLKFQGREISLVVITINIFKRKKKKTTTQNQEDTHAWCQRTASVPNTLEKLFQNNSSMGKYDPYNITEVSETHGDLLSKEITGQMKDACGGILSWDSRYLGFGD